MRKNKQLHFTDHVLKRMSQRGISKNLVYAVIRNGYWSRGYNASSFKVEHKGVVVILYEQKHRYDISSCRLNREYTLLAEKMKQQNGISFWESLHLIMKDLEKEILN
ncbi:DUF4258 domain-containing protein [Bacillus mojavensis]